MIVILKISSVPDEIKCNVQSLVDHMQCSQYRSYAATETGPHVGLRAPRRVEGPLRKEHKKACGLLVQITKVLYIKLGTAGNQTRYRHPSSVWQASVRMSNLLYDKAIKVHIHTFRVFHKDAWYISGFLGRFLNVCFLCYIIPLKIFTLQHRILHQGPL